jgi:hypothetical protein
MGLIAAHWDDAAGVALGLFVGPAKASRRRARPDGASSFQLREGRAAGAVVTWARPLLPGRP